MAGPGHQAHRGAIAALKQRVPVETKLVVRHIFVDFHNGGRYREDREKDFSSPERLALRLAAQGHFNSQGEPQPKNLDEVLKRYRQCQASVNDFTVTQVLHRIAEEALEGQSEDTAAVLVVHLDEFQFYVDNMGNNRSFKCMLNDIGDFMVNGVAETPLDGRVCVVPVLTGTAGGGRYVPMLSDFNTCKY